MQNYMDLELLNEVRDVKELLSNIHLNNEIMITFDLKKYFSVRLGIIDVLLRRKIYVRAVDGVSFRVYEGEVFCLAGESGCGKTTTGRTVIGLTLPTSGYVIYRPRREVAKKLIELGYEPIKGDYFLLNDLFKVRKINKLLRRELQIIFQDPYSALNPRHTVGYIVEEPLIIQGFKDREERRRIVYQVLRDVKLTPPEDFINRRPHQLSGGQRQRVVIARALVLNPRFIVADEPVSMLDVSIRAEILKLMLELREKRKLTYLFITHDLATARLICNRIAIMYLGKIVEQGRVTDVLTNPQHPYTKALMLAIPEPEPERKRLRIKLPIKGEVPSAINIPPGCRFHPRCPHTMDLCRRKEPPLIKVDTEHFVACWLYAKR